MDETYFSIMDKYYKQSCYMAKEPLIAQAGRFLRKEADTDLLEKNWNNIFWPRRNGYAIAGLALVLTDMPKVYTNSLFPINTVTS